MLKTLTGLDKKVKPIEKNIECLHQAVTMFSLKKYFDRIINHDFIDMNVKNSAYFYCCFSYPKQIKVKIISCIKCNLPAKIAGKVLHSPEYRVFYEDRDRVLSKCITEAEQSDIDAIKITLRSRLIGYYIPKDNILLATDWTHNRKTLEIMEYVWPKLLEDIKPRKVKLRKCKKLTVTIGCDPEFEIKSGSRTICASSIIHDTGNLPIGVDGAGGPLELRPEPGSPAAVVKNIKQLINKFYTNYRNKDLSIQGDIYAVGGHIHVGIGMPFNPPRQLVEMLDDFVGRPTIELSGRARGEYKVLGGYRSQPWGFEYRTPPAAVFATPQVARIILKIAKNVTETFLNSKEITYNEPPTDEDYITIAKLTQNEINLFRKFISNSEQYIQKSVIANWTGKRVIPPPKQIKFRDDWDGAVINDLLTALKEALPMQKLKFDILLYGLKENRGMVSNIEFADVQKLTEYPRTHPQDFNNGQLEIGLPFAIRTNWDEYTVRKDALIKAIQEKVKKSAARK